jgi:hypothetical protein
VFDRRAEGGQALLNCSVFEIIELRVTFWRVKERESENKGICNKVLGDQLRHGESRIHDANSSD